MHLSSSSTGLDAGRHSSVLAPARAGQRRHHATPPPQHGRRSVAARIAADRPTLTQQQRLLLFQLQQQQQQQDSGRASSPSPADDGLASLSYASIEDAGGSSIKAALMPDVCLHAEVARLQALLAQLTACSSLADKVALLEAQPQLQQLRNLTRSSGLWEALGQLPLEQQYVVLCLPAIGQSHTLMLAPAEGRWTGPLSALAAGLCRVESFYDSMGGLVGYQATSLQLINTAKQSSSSAAAAAAAAATPQQPPPAATSPQQRPASSSSSMAVQDAQAHVTYHVPPGLDLAGEAGRETGVAAAAQGLLALPHLSEILPVGGAGDRLGLRCEVTGQSLPAAMLPYCGRSMIEGQVRDLQAKEYLYWHLTGTQVTTPVAIMTSDAKGNHSRISGLLADADWFGRPQGSFRLFRQPLVPVVDASDGRWLLTRPLKLMMKPGGHGAIWKLMHDEGVFDWLQRQGRTAALVRQISNPMAGCDTTLLALAGTGYGRRAAFGFMSCERVVGAAEGMNVLREAKTWVADPALPEGGRWQYEYAVTNVEYTEFERLGISDQPLREGSSHSAFPANTNILYVGLHAARAAVEGAIAAGSGEVLPGLIFNLKKTVTFFDPLLNEERSVRAGRMECTMQNLADALATRTATRLVGSGSGSSSGQPGASSESESEQQQLSTFMVYNMRRKVTSSAKKQRSPASSTIHQTPEGAFYDLQRNAWQVLQRCGMRHVPAVGDVQEYLTHGPGFIFLHHPALGPLWDVIAQKIKGGAMMPGSELVLEVAEARLLDVTVDGSLLVLAENVMGHWEEASHHHTQPGSSNGSSSNGSSNGSGSGQPGGRLQYSRAAGRVHLMNVAVHNVGVDWHHPGNVCWQHRVSRHEACVIRLHGRSEFEAYDCRITGDQVFEVPDGYRMVVTSGGHASHAPAGRLNVQLHPLQGAAPTWEWAYSMEPSGAIALQFVRNAPLAALWRSPLLTAAPHAHAHSHSHSQQEYAKWQQHRGAAAAPAVITAVLDSADEEVWDWVI